MNFASDNWSGVAPQVSQSLLSNSHGYSTAYGNSEVDKKVKSRFCEIFENDVAVFFVGTGTIANSLSIASLSRPGGISLCHREAHLIEDECGAPDFFSGGGRMVGVDGGFGKMDCDKLVAALDRFDPNFVHYGQPTAISVTQSTEAGCVYSLEELGEISQIAKSYKLPLHMDGSRFANALVHLDVTPAQMTWKSGIDILSFGGTKNGCWCAEAIVLFDPEMAEQMAYIHKRAGQLYSKTRFIAAQYDAYFDNNLWLDLANKANQMADRLRQGIVKSTKARLGWRSQCNEIFCIMPFTIARSLEDMGVKFYDWGVRETMAERLDKDESLYRFVTSFDTTSDEIDQVLKQFS